ncbi:MAG: hypothetical protein JNL61_20635 [Rhizobiaceae bacterium]|nr:hypothetical protein [Rhizobiaceae bacterium]
MRAARLMWERIEAYAAHDDPRSQAANWIALVVAWNQPFYPLYLWWIVGLEKTAPSLLTFLSTPVFAAIPALSRRHPLAARALLPLAGIANGFLATKALGVGSGVQMFLLPCALIAAALFRPSERLLGLSMVALCAAAYFLPDRWYGPALADYTAAEIAAMARLNILSAATLVVFIGLLMSNLAERGADHP